MYWSLLQQAGESELLTLNDANAPDGTNELSLADQISALAMEDSASGQNEEASQEQSSAVKNGKS